jgi:hypothetical protein
MAIALALTGLAVVAVIPASASHAPADVTGAQVLQAVRQAQNITTVPSSLRPPLTNSNDIESLSHGGVCAAHYKWPKVGIDALHFGQCAYGDPHGKNLAVIFGDSHAGMWLTALKAIGARTGWAVRAFYFPGCPAPDLTFWSDQTIAPNTACNTFRSDAIAAIKALHPQLTLVTSGSLSQPVTKGVAATSDQWQAGLTRTLQSLAEPGTRLVVIGDIPILAQNDPDCLAAHESNVRACMTPVDQAEQGVLLGAEQAAAAASGAQYVPTAQWMCAAQCVPIVGNMRVYNDQYHISATYATYLSGALQASLGLSPAGATTASKSSAAGRPSS